MVLQRWLRVYAASSRIQWALLVAGSPLSGYGWLAD
jgi:hypothetical protein